MVLSFVVPVAIMAAALLKIQVSPGGKFTLLIYDMKGLFLPIISSIRYIGSGDNSVFLSFSGGLANNAYLNLISYLADPAIWLTVLIPLDRLPDAVYFTTLFKIGLCGVGACVYFFFGYKGMKRPAVILILSVCYALMSYNIMFSQCLLWFNVVALAPVVIVGIEHIIEGKRGALYILSMTLSLCYNYQLAYMVGIFSIMYLIWRLCETGTNKKKIIIRFVLCNVLCAGIIMPIFIPVVYNVMGGRMNSYNFVAGRSFYYPLWSVLGQFLSCRYDTIESGGLPLIYCGSFIPFIALASIVFSTRPKKCRIISIFIIAFFVASFCIVPLNEFWHGFTEPNSFPVRYSFLLCLYLLILAYDMVCSACKRFSVQRSALYFVYFVAMAITCTEMYLNSSYVLTGLNIEMTYGIVNRYESHVTRMSDALSSIRDDGFYRIGSDLPYTANNGMMFGFNGIGYFSSMFERGAMDFLGQLGYSQNEHTLTDAGGTPISESLLGVKYKVLLDPDSFGYYENKYKNDLFEVQYNKNALPVGFIMDYKKIDYGSVENLEEGIAGHNSFAYQEYVLSELLGERVHAYEMIDYSIDEVQSADYKRNIRMRFTAKDDRPVWICCNDENNGETITATRKGEKFDSVLSVNGKNRYPFVSRLSTLCIYLGKFNKGEEVVVEAACTNPFDDPWIVYYNEDECNRALDKIRQRSFEVTEHKNGVIKGNIDIADDDDLLVMTLPSMRGYRVKVDGKRTEYGAYRDALFALKMEPGEHTVEISFIPYGFIPGAFIGAVCLALTILYLLRKKPEDKTYEPAG